MQTMDYCTWLIVGAKEMFLFLRCGLIVSWENNTYCPSSMKGKYYLLFIMFCYFQKKVGPEVVFHLLSLVVMSADTHYTS